MKTCFKCNKEKPLNEFYKHKQMADGHVNKCKTCNKKDVSDHRAINIDKIKAYDKKRYKEDPKVKARHLIYSKSEAGKAAQRRCSLNYIERNPIKRAAHIIVGNAIRDKKLFKMSCERCSELNVHAHHDDYALPLSVRWLCTKHHSEWHKENGEGVNAH